MTLQIGQPESDLRRLNEVQPWSPVIHGVPARGELLVADRWDGSWREMRGARLRVARLRVARLRVVVLLPGTEPPPREQLPEGVVVCVPSPALREAPAPYLGAAPAPPLAAYAAGSLIMSSGSLPAPSAHFRGEWPQALERLASAVVEASPTWGDAEPWAQALLQQAANPRQLFQGLSALQQSLSTRLATRAALPAELQGLLGEAQPVLQRLRALAEAGDLRQFLQRCWEVQSSPDALAADGALLRGLQRVLEAAPEVLEAQAFLAEAEVGSDDEDLRMDRQVLLEQLILPALARSPHLWPSVRSLFQMVRSHYQTLYVARHRACQDEGRRLEALAREDLTKARALARLNSITQLGPPVDPEVAARWPFILTSLAPCSADPPALGAGARCARCGFSLSAPSQAPEFLALWERLTRALREQQERLSASAIRQVLARADSEEVEKLVQIVQASDLAPLVQVLDDRLVAFIQELLAAERRLVVSPPVLQEMGRRFALVDEDQVEQVAQALADLLRDSFAQAKAQHPDKDIRLRLG